MDSLTNLTLISHNNIFLVISLLLIRCFYWNLCDFTTILLAVLNAPFLEKCNAPGEFIRHTFVIWYGCHWQFLFLIGWYKELFYSETAWPSGTILDRKHIFEEAFTKFAQFILIGQQLWPPWEKGVKIFPEMA